jgi:hypothetical protein
MITGYSNDGRRIGETFFSPGNEELSAQGIRAQRRANDDGCRTQAKSYMNVKAESIGGGWNEKTRPKEWGVARRVSLFTRLFQFERAGEPGGHEHRDPQPVWF